MASSKSGTKRSSSSASGRSRGGSSSASRSASSSRSTSRSSGPAKASNGNNTRARKTPAEPEKPTEVTFADYLHQFTKTRAFIPVSIILITVALVLIDMLIAWNKYDLFFKILGFELIILAIFVMFILIMGMSTTLPAKKEKEEE